MLSVFFAWYLFSTRELSRTFKVGVIVLSVLSVAGMAFLNEAFSARLFASGLRETINQGSTLSILSNGRADIYALILNLIFSGDTISIILGVGSEMFHVLNFGGSAHNVFLEIFIEGGLVSLGLYFIWTLFLYREIILRAFRSPELVGLLLAMLVSMMLSHGLGFFGNLLFGLLLAYKSCENRKNDRY